MHLRSIGQSTTGQIQARRAFYDPRGVRLWHFYSWFLYGGRETEGFRPSLLLFPLQRIARWLRNLFAHPLLGVARKAPSEEFQIVLEGFSILKGA